ncbi:type IV secretion system protein VirB10 [Ochrobactrum anthropi]|uniref:type IV secretion system protein VirB10 n=1 Tax=Brucella anthropi TaxID=529 RepID=UPI0015F804BB|nr:type IV secretion system protein VirB10 [Brucella anthropi]MBA8862725.1 type IV secretion system protein VirB10 [Brucella anthropi]
MSAEKEEAVKVNGERGPFNPNGGAGKKPDMAKRGAVVAAVIAGAGLMAWSTLSADKEVVEAPKKIVVKQTAAFEAAPVPKAEPLPVVQQPVASPATPGMPAPVMAEKKEEDPLLDAAKRAPVIAYSGNSMRNSMGSGGSGNPYVDVPAEKDPEATRFSNMMKPTVLQGAKAGTLGDRNYVVAMGTSIPCILETALSSDQPGFASCVINRDIMSDNGRVVLMEKGTQVVGEYRGGLKRGQSRLFVLWNRAKTPKGVTITLASPATDAIGRAGFDGNVDKHFMERFGAALLLSVVGDATSFAAKKMGEADMDADETVNSGKQASAIAVEQSINIAPTLTKHQGSLVNIFVARDLDFSDVYQLKVTEPQNRIFDRAVQGDFHKYPDIVTK